jgi:predicted transcriptional regulator
MTTTLRIGIATYEEIKSRTIAIARGERRRQPNEPKLWFTSMQSLAKVLSGPNRDLLRIIATKTPKSLGELATLSGREKSNLSRTLKTLENYGLIKRVRDKQGRKVPRVTHDRVELVAELVPARKATKATVVGHRPAAAAV